jgi:hypothetical protein
MSWRGGTSVGLASKVAVGEGVKVGVGVSVGAMVGVGVTVRVGVGVVVGEVVGEQVFDKYSEGSSFLSGDGETKPGVLSIWSEEKLAALFLAKELKLTPLANPKPAKVVNRFKKSRRVILSPIDCNLLRKPKEDSKK